MTVFGLYLLIMTQSEWQFVLAIMIQSELQINQFCFPVSLW